MKYADRLKEATTTTGTGVVTLAGAVAGYRTLASRLTVGDVIGYCIEGQTPGEWEVGIGTLTTSSTVTRSYVSASSNSDQLVNFSAGTKNIFVTATASMLHDGVIDTLDVGYDIIGLIGQSNIAGRGTLNTSIEIADNRVWQFGCTSGQALYQTIFAGNDPLHNEEGVNTGQMSLGTVACKTYASIRPSNRRVLIVPCGHGGTPLYSGAASWSVGGSLYLNAIAQANAAITAAQLQYPNSRFVGCFWHQGESDAVAGVSQANYQTALTNAIAGYRAGITGAANSWFVIGGMVPEAISGNPSGYNPIVAAHQAVAAAVDRCTYVAGPSGYTGDNLHYNAAGCRVMGVRMALGVRTAQLYSAAPVPVTDVTMSGPSGGIVSVASTNFTVGVSPGGGVITGTVVVTPSDGGAGGTFTPTTVSLLTGTASGTFTYTPASTGAKTISVTNNGGLGNPANITYTVSAAATVPGAPTIGTATAGDTTASVAFTAPASDGGSAITGYTATSSPGGLTGTGASSPITVTGLTNGTAYTFTVTATNAVGTGAASAASNSVTPASTDLRARAGFTNLTEGGSSGAWTYTGTGGAAFDATGAVMNMGRAASSTNAAFTYVRQAAVGAADKFTVCVISGTSPLALANRVFTFLHDSGGTYTGYAGGSAITPNGVDHPQVAAVGDWVRVRFTSTTSCVFEVSKNSGGSWFLIHTLTGVSTGALNFQLQLLGGTTGRYGGFVGANLTAN